MNEWDQRIREHRVWAEMQALGPVIDAAYNLNDVNVDTLSGLERLREILGYAGKRLAAADPLLTTPAPLEEMAIGFLSAREAVQRFISDTDPAHIQTANSLVEKVLTAITQIPGDYSPEELGALISSAIEHRTIIQHSLLTARKSVDEFNATTQQLRNGLAQLTGVIQSEQQKMSAIVTEYQGQFSAAQEKRSEEFSSVLRIAQKDFTNLSTEYQAQFSAGQDTRSKEFLEAQAVRQKGYSDLEEAYKKRAFDQDSQFASERTELAQTQNENLKVLTAGYQADAQTILTAIKNQQAEVEKVVGVVGNLAVTSGYLRTANQAKYMMWLWQALTVAAMVTLSILAYRTLGLLENSNGQFNWGGFAARVLLLGSLGVIAAYSGSQADKLFVDEKKNRKLALELEAIGPYLAPLPVDEQNKFRVQIGDRSFGRDHEVNIRTHGKSPVSIVDLLKSKEGKEVLEVLIDLIKKSNGAK